MLAEAGAELCRLVADILDGNANEVTLMKRLVEVAFESGVPAGLLFEHLTERGQQNAELAANLAEWAKLRVQEMSKP